MAHQGEVVLRPRVCQCCHVLFWICIPCDHGQRYCSPPCRAAAVREQRRRANRRHQRSPEGRLDHRDRQREYRKRCAQRRVTDKSSPVLTSPRNMPEWDSGSAKTAVRVTSTTPFLGLLAPIAWAERHRESPSILLRCVVCGRTSYFVNPFPTIPRF